MVEYARNVAFPIEGRKLALQKVLEVYVAAGEYQSIYQLRGAAHQLGLENEVDKAYLDGQNAMIKKFIEKKDRIMLQHWMNGGDSNRANQDIRNAAGLGYVDLLVERKDLNGLNGILNSKNISDTVKDAAKKATEKVLEEKMKAGDGKEESVTTQTGIDKTNDPTQRWTGDEIEDVDKLAKNEDALGLARVMMDGKYGTKRAWSDLAVQAARDQYDKLKLVLYRSDEGQSKLADALFELGEKPGLLFIAVDEKRPIALRDKAGLLFVTLYSGSLKPHVLQQVVAKRELTPKAHKAAKEMIRKIKRTQEGCVNHGLGEDFCIPKQTETYCSRSRR